MSWFSFFFFLPDSFQTTGKPDVADKSLLAFADGGVEWPIDHAILQQYTGEKGKIFPANGILKRDGRGRDGDGLCSARRAAVAEQDGRSEIGVCFSDAGAGVAERDTSMPHGIYHKMTEGNLFLPHSHSIFRKKAAKEPLRLCVSILLFACDGASLPMADGKLMRRGYEAAPHGFAVNGNLNLTFLLQRRICCPPPGACGNHAGESAAYRPLTGLLRVFLITTRRQPTHLTCGQTIVRISASSEVMAKEACRAFFRAKGIAPTRTTQAASPKREKRLHCGAIPAFSPASLAQTGTYPHG